MLTSLCPVYLLRPWHQYGAKTPPWEHSIKSLKPQSPPPLSSVPLHCTRQHLPKISAMTYLQKPHPKPKAKPKSKPRIRQNRRSATPRRKYRVTIRSLPKEIRQQIFLISYLNEANLVIRCPYCICDGNVQAIDNWTTKLLKVDAALCADIKWAAKTWGTMHEKERQAQREKFLQWFERGVPTACLTFTA